MCTQSDGHHRILEHPTRTAVFKLSQVECGHWTQIKLLLECSDLKAYTNHDFHTSVWMRCRVCRIHASWRPDSVGYSRCISSQASLKTSEHFVDHFWANLAFLAVSESDIAPVNYVFKLIEIQQGILLHPSMHDQLLFIFSWFSDGFSSFVFWWSWSITEYLMNSGECSI